MYSFALLAASLIGIHQTPVGAQLHIRLATPVGSYGSKEGQPVSGVLIAPVTASTGEILLPQGATVTGYVKRAKRVGLGVKRETATLELDFNEIRLRNGGSLALSSRVDNVDNGRERVVADGSILGVRSTASIAYRMSGYLRTALGWEIHARLAMEIVNLALVHVPEPEIYYPPGTELTLALTEPVFSTPLPETGGGELTDADREHLRAMVAEMPYRTTDKEGDRSSDLVNVIFVGTRQQITEAFTAAGWMQASQTNFRTRYVGARAVAEGLGYASAPMSQLNLGDMPPDMAWQKTLNDVAKRHHVRIWKQPQTWNGQEVWVGAATHDVDFAYLRHGYAVVHRIEQDIDRERDKIAYDLQFTSCTDLVDWWERPGAPTEARNATGDPMTTDGELAIIRLNDCRSPRVVKPQETDPIAPHGKFFARVLRREILSVRSDYYRENVYWRSYEGARWMVAAVRRRYHHPSVEPRQPHEPETAAGSLLGQIRNSSWVR